MRSQQTQRLNDATLPFVGGITRGQPVPQPPCVLHHCVTEVIATIVYNARAKRQECGCLGQRKAKATAQHNGRTGRVGEVRNEVGEEE